MAETIYTKVDYDLGSLVNFIELGEIALPDIQRPFVWSNAKVRNLFDSIAAGRSPAQLAYFAALILLDANVLFSDQKVSELLDPSANAKRAAIEKHHLFPKTYLGTIGVSTRRRTNQLANYALVEWGDNSKASSDDPKDYLPGFIGRFNNKELERMYYWHALPEAWESMGYDEFLIERRERMSAVIKDAYQSLTGSPDDEKDELDVNDLVGIGESDEIEFKSTLRYNLHTGKYDKKMEHACLKTIAGFLNRSGGRLVIGVADDGEPLGLDDDGFANEDKMNLHLVNLVKSKIDPQFMMYISPRFEDYEGVRVYVVECQPSRSPVFLKDGNQEVFYVRTGASTSELTGKTMQEYIKQRFGSKS